MKLSLSYHQKLLLHQHRSEKLKNSCDAKYNHIPLLIRIQGAFDKDLLCSAIQNLLKKYDILNSGIVDDMLKLNNWEKPVPVTFAKNYLSTLNEAIKLLSEISWQSLANTQSIIPAKAYLLEWSENDFILNITFHSLFVDRWSLVNIYNGLVAHFKHLLSGNTATETEDLVQYKDFYDWHQALPGDLMEDQRFYWVSNLPEKLDPIELPKGKQVLTDEYVPCTFSFNINNDLYNKVQRCLEELQVSEFSLFAANLSILLYKYTERLDIVIGTHGSNRYDHTFSGIVGPLANFLAINCNIDLSNNVKAHLAYIDRQYAKALENQIFPYEKLIQELGYQVQPINVTIDVDTVSTPSYSFNNIACSYISCNYGYGKYDLSFLFRNDGAEFNSIITYNSSVFHPTIIEELANNYKVLLGLFVERIESTVEELNYNTRNISEILNTPDLSPSTQASSETLVSLWNKQVKKHPQKIAVKYDQTTVTFLELDRLSDAICLKLLNEYHITKSNHVAVLMSNSEMLVASILAVLKCGAAYVPIDPKMPYERVSFILKDAQCSVIIVDDKILNPENVKTFECSTLIAKNYTDVLSEKELVLPAIKPYDSAYIIYTSGTTGKPKGCIISHRNVVSLLMVLQPELKIDPDDVWLLAHSYSFDFSIVELFGALLVGGKLIIPHQKISDINALYNLVTENRVSIFTQTPMAFKAFTEVECLKEQHQLKDFLKVVLLGGEKLVFSALKSWIGLYSTDDIRIINGYGPTETTVFATFYALNDTVINYSRSSMIGTPLPDTTAYVLDRNFNKQPTGVSGELYIGGNGVSSGYLNKPDMTKERFIMLGTEENPIVLYRTGDIVNFHADGNIEYIGRTDNQVKINGYRIELEEIENCLRDIEGVKDAIVNVLSGDADNKYLIAYYLADDVKDEDILHRYLKSVLPKYMLPARYVKLEYFPLTQNGKKDRSALPYISLAATFTGTKPSQKIDIEIENLFREILKIKDTDIYLESDFFALGGDSLNAIMLILKIETLYCTKITLEELFENSTLGRLSLLLQSKHGDKPSYSPAISLTKAKDASYYPMSSSQERVFVLQQLTPGDFFYNVTQVLEIRGDVNIEDIRVVIQKLVQRHEILRTSFKLIDGMPVQIIHYEVDVDIQSYCEQGEIAGLVRPFDLSNAPLFRVAYFKNPQGTMTLFFDMHHIITDYLSQEILVNEFITFLAHEDIKPLTYQYKDYAVWQKEKLKVGIAEMESYWIRKYNDGIQRIELPFDYNDPPHVSYEGREYSVSLSKEISATIRQIAANEGVTEYMLLIALFNVFLSKLSSGSIIKVGTPVLGRNNSELLNLLGFFSNTIVISNELTASESFHVFLQKVKDECIMSFSNQDYPFEMLVEKVGANNDIGGNPLFNVMFTYKKAIGNKENSALKKLNEKGILFVKKEYVKTKSLFDLSLHVVESEGQFLFSFEYKTTLFKHETIISYSEWFKNITEQVLADITLPVGKIQLLNKPDIDKYLALLNGENMEFGDGNVISLFESQVAGKSSDISLCQDAHELTYLSLNNRANQLAKHICAVGVASGDFVAILYNRTPNMIAGILAIMKAGAAYLPIDPSLPVERVNMILSDANVRCVVTQQEHCHLITNNVTVITPEEIIDDSIYEENLSVSIDAEMPAYAIYTSGSTGRPKGVVINHKSLYNYISWLNELFPKGAEKGVLASATLSFDMSISEIFYPLAFGGKIYLIDSLLDTQRLNMICDKITFMVSVPSVVSSLFEYINAFSSLRVLGLGGEAIDIPVLNRIKKSVNAVIYNMYGPTEATVAPAYFNCNTVKDDEKEVSIGYPIANTKILILDESMNMLPPTVRGELYIGGTALAIGYLNNQLLTNEKFVPDPFENGKKLYKTGDLGFYNSEGKIFYKGRQDDQVKIRGYRVELNEIIVGIRSIPGISNAVVLVKEDAGKIKHLSAYYTGEDTINSVIIKKYLIDKLPGYMIPTEYYKLEKIPIKKNGKVDTEVLLSMKNVELDNETDELQVGSEVGDIITSVLKKYLPNSKMGVNTSFFDLGLNSLMLLNVVNDLSTNFGLTIPPVNFFKYPTIYQLSEFLAKGTNEDWDSDMDADSLLLKSTVKLFDDDGE